MYKVVVVDDEPLILRSIKKSIEDAHAGFKVTAEATNGEDAITVIEQASPDVVFTDIRMPVVDGLALIEELHKRQIQTRLVILSGYQEFDYAKRALKFGVEEYLLKPIDRNELTGLLSKIYNSLEELKKQKQLQLLKLLINKDINTVIPPSEICRNFDGFDFFAALLICSGSNCTFNCNWLTPAKDFWLKTDLNLVLCSVLQNTCTYWVLELDHGNDRLVILASQHDFKESLNRVYEQLYEELNKTRFPVTVITGKPVTAAGDLPYTIQYLKILLNKSTIFANSRLVFSNTSDDNGKNPERLIDINLEKLLYRFIDKKQPEQFKLEFKKLLNAYEDRQSTQLRLESMLKHTVNLFQLQSGQIPENRLLEAEMEINELVSNSATYKSLSDGMSIIFDDLFYLLKNQSIEKKDQNLLIDQVEVYIRQNYSQQISLQSIADRFGLALPYLSSIFKKCKGVSPMEFIIKLRVEKAKELLQTYPSLTLIDIAQAVGYDDPYYMSRVFKSSTGQSPSEYKNCKR